jgi:YesN/AraC family two-component response regulator
LQDVADALDIHPVWLSRLFKKETGQNFLDYVTEVRLGEAKRLLQESHLKVYEISEKVGYQDLQYFGKLFKRQYGMTPKECKKKK